ncbi:uncharacterized protein LOC123670566 isoform X2 [Harmonia axyridis]|uniref:uncharacterized protein LOC123670566 isoform X2 n=1 Tax=Harmonia axyridis TaxID=115357 RepID=UPI001E27825E|nr:uncharacterized protein LOC123670566 isoform X2 [Harmonia axyridis]
MHHLKMELTIFAVIISTFINFPLCNTQTCRCNDPPPCPDPPVCPDPPACPDPPSCNPSPPDCEPTPSRCKREVEPTLFPYPGTWYKDSESGKFYYHLGNTVYVERSDKYYTIWVTSGDGADWAQNDNYVWKWDENGRWYPHKEDEDDASNNCSKFRIPIECVGPHCPKQIQFPSDGKWWYLYDGRNLFEQSHGDIKYELQSHGMYYKFKGNVQVCPDNWLWNVTDGQWFAAQDTKKACVMNEPQENNEVIQGRGRAFEPPRKVFGL